MTKIWIIAIAAFVIDQATKYGVVWGLDLRNVYAIDVLPPILNFRMAWNEGINFGLFSSDVEIMRWVLVALALVICAWVLYWGRQFTGWFAALLIGLIVGGALGNVIDRIIHGAVINFLNMSCCGINNPYAFNLADVWVFAGAIGLIFFAEKLPKKA